MFLTPNDFAIQNGELVRHNDQGYSFVFFFTNDCTWCDDVKPAFNYLSKMIRSPVVLLFYNPATSCVGEIELQTWPRGYLGCRLTSWGCPRPGRTGLFAVRSQTGAEGGRT